MKNTANKSAENSNTSQLQQILFNYLPYWPVFLILLVLSFSYLIFYLKTTMPGYKSTASILIKDEKKGEEGPKVDQMLNLFGTKNIVENQVEILKSTPILKDVIRKLNLSSPVFEERGWKGLKKSLAYKSSPIDVQVKNPAKVYPPKENKFYFTINSDSSISIGDQRYPMNQWVKTPWDSMRFVKNPRYSPYVPSPKDKKEDEPKFYFVLLNEATVMKILDATYTAAPTNKLSTVVELRVNDLSPDRGEAMLDAIVNAYHQLNADRNNNVAQNTLSWIEKRLGEVTTELDSLEKGIQTYRNNQGVVDISEQSRLYLQGAEETDKQLNAYNIQMAALDEVEKYVKSKSTEGSIVPSTFNISDPILKDLVDKLYNAESNYQKLKGTTGENNPILISVQEEINKTKPSILENIQNQKSSLNAGISRLNQMNSKYSSMLSTIPKKERNLVEVSRARSTKADIYTFLLGKREEVIYSINSASHDSYFVDKPHSDDGPVSPNRNLLAMMALVAPLGLGALGISLKEMLNSKILYRADIEKICSFPVAGEIIYHKNENLLSPENSFVAEQFRHLRNSLKYIGDPSLPLKRVLVTSSIMGEGKSYVSINLAKSLAKSGKKVALLELDLHQPRLREFFGIHDVSGITEYLTGEVSADDLVVPTDIHPNLYLIPSGNPVEDASELLMAEKFSLLLDNLDQRFDILIIDSPPVKAISDAFVIADHVNLILYVIRHNHTPKSIIQLLDQEMEKRNLHNVALVFNGVKPRGYGKFSYGYGRGYGYDFKSSYEAYNKKKTKVS